MEGTSIIKFLFCIATEKHVAIELQMNIVFGAAIAMGAVAFVQKTAVCEERSESVKWSRENFNQKSNLCEHFLTTFLISRNTLRDKAVHWECKQSIGG